jgi:hypothetical protein
MPAAEAAIATHGATTVVIGAQWWGHFTSPRIDANGNALSTQAGRDAALAAIPGTVPFDDAAQSWVWTVASLAARHGAGLGRGTQGGQGGVRIARPCDPDDVIRALDLLYRRGGIGPTHARVLRRWGERFTVPAPGGTSAEDALLWSEAMAQLDGVLRPKGILL